MQSRIHCSVYFRKSGIFAEVKPESIKQKDSVSFNRIICFDLGRVSESTELSQHVKQDTCGYAYNKHTPIN